MKIMPEIANHRKSLDIDWQNLDFLTLNHKASIHTYDSDAVDRVNATYATLNSPPDFQANQMFNFKKQAKQCRICLQNSIENQAQLLSLCKCSGSVEFIHQNCFRQWIQKSLKCKKSDEKRKIMKKKQVECQMCKHKIPITFQEITKLKKCQKAYQSIKNRPKMFGFIISISFIGLVLLIYIISLISTKGLNFNSQQNTFLQSILMISSSVLLIFLCIVTIGYIVEQFFLEYQIIVGKINSKQDLALQIQKKRKVSVMSGQCLSPYPYPSPFKQRKHRIKRQMKSPLEQRGQIDKPSQTNFNPESINSLENARKKQINSQFKIKRITENQEPQI